MDGMVVTSSNGAAKPKEPASSGVPPTSAPPASAVVVDVDAKRHELLRLLADLLRGKEDPSAIAKVTRFKGQRLANLQSLIEAVGRQNPHDAAVLKPMEQWISNLLKANLRTRQEIFHVAENLSKPAEEKNALEKFFRRG